jgi:hypothetical protein
MGWLVIAASDRLVGQEGWSRSIGVVRPFFRCGRLRVDNDVQRKDVTAVSDSYLNTLLASGEVLLIETRQHWVAAIRYVLRPILILLLAAGLLLLNSWLDFGDGFLGFINDLVTWIAAILFIVSIVWMPIDLVRWASRKYVLTSRRVMRMDGVLRKRSFDSSLE